MKKIIFLVFILLISSIAFCESEKVKIPSDVWKLDMGNIGVEKLLTYKLPVILDFGADWCGPCRKFHPILEETNIKYKNKAIVKYVDVDKNEKLAIDYSISAIPCQIFWNKEGKAYKPSKNILNKIYFDFIKDKKGNLLYTYHLGGLSIKEIDMILQDMGVKLNEKNHN